jgi:hypothetical protein
LPVVQNRAPEDVEAAERPRAQWVTIGAGLTLAIFVPLALCALPLGRVLTQRLVPPAGEAASAGMQVLIVLGLAGPQLLAFALSAFASGALVGRFGGLAKTKDAALGALLGALVAVALTAMSGALRPWLVAVATAVVLGLLGAVFGALGGRFGEVRRPRL